MDLAVRMTARTVLALNAGSTSVKISKFVDGAQVTAPTDLNSAVDDEAPDAIVHRVVHGGDRSCPELIDDDALDRLRGLTELAPLHQPPALDAIQRCRDAWPDAVQIACFDTAFHTDIPAVARAYALPRRLRNKVRVYGFHGISHAWSSDRLRDHAPQARRVLIAHLGGGQSLCGVLDGHSHVTTMGFTPLDGLVMATRSGTVDPGALLWLAKHTDEDLDTVLETESGLLGLAGTADMKDLLDRARSGDQDCRFARDVWLHRFLQQAGGCIAALGGIDALAFTGGVGEHSDETRRRIVERLQWLGVRITDETEQPPDDITEITAPGSRVRTFVIRAREDLQMLRDADTLLT